MIMTYQNPLDWASEAFYDSEENENSELERDPEIIFKTYLKELFFFVFTLLKNLNFDNPKIDKTIKVDAIFRGGMSQNQ